MTSPRTTWSFYSAGQLCFGAGGVRQLGQLCGRRQWQRILIVTDPVLLGCGLVDRVVQPLAEAQIDVEIFSEGEAEPSIEVAQSAVLQAADARPDAILGLGGGSNMDLAKIVALLDRHGGRAADYFGFDRVPGPVTPLVCIPTTAGTGSEVSHAAVLTDRQQQLKVSTLSQHLRPALAVVDPELTYSCPPRVTADSGIDALTHAIEALTANDYAELPLPPGESSAYEGRFPLSDLLAEKAVALIGQHLVAAVQQPENRAAREAMALAATLAGLAFSNAGVALVHALEYPLGGALHCSHGAGNGLLLPYVMQFNLPERQATLARIAELLGVDTRGMSQLDAAQAAIDFVVQLRRTIGIPHQIRELGGSEDQLPEFAAKSFAIKRLLWVNPRAASQQDLLEILRHAW